MNVFGNDESDGNNWHVIAAVLAGVAAIAAFAGVAYILNGLFAAVAFLFALGLGAGIPLAGVVVLKSGFPLGNILAQWLAILAQFVLGSGALARTADGGYEWHRLEETGDGYRVRLDDGSVLDMDGDRGDLYRFGTRPLAMVEEKGANVEQFTVREEPPETAQEATREHRAGFPVHHPRRIDDGSYLLSLKQLAQPASGSGGPALARRGREKALEEAGGQQAIGGIWLTIMTGGLAVVGFVLAYGMMLI